MMRIKNFSAAFALLLGLVGCNSSTEKNNQTATVTSYKTISMSPDSVLLYSDFPATLEGVENIEIRPKIEGFIEKVLVDEGEYVTKGELLFILDAPTYEQDVRNAQAAIESNKAAVSTAKVDVEKAKPLVAREIISKFELTSAENTLKSAEAALEQAEADLVNAKINNNYTRVTSPVSGVIGTLPYKLGSLVSSSTTDPLTKVSNIDSIYAYFSINEKTLLNFFRNTKGTYTTDKIKSLPEVQLLLSDGSTFDETGKVQTISGQVDEETGSFNVRAIFDNPYGMLRTGNSATVRIPNTMKNIFLIPQAATYEIQGNVYVYVVDENSKAKAVKITVTATPNGKAYVVTDGLKKGDKVIVEGINSLSDGKEVKAEMVKASEVKALQEVSNSSEITTEN
ncbi:membrane fusion protein, multidrug efflux system [Pustulibacterium marinum]|uniref:Membrane fusion protein, multidrug efflux system n=1 Tax=Pustulibacterium marinum TaxID=1224947 RepID=A0A1I7ITB0_9FLAO|nr:efflux RND transporter periplasmic adaptor subunit [Pustulibacterium marinum]SFU76149.1 membrane fusion protein, multidrug efflux system [Pustulibacterium marinum]